MKKTLKLIAGRYVGGYNDTTCYEIEIEHDGKKLFAEIENKGYDMQIPNHRWKLICEEDLCYEQKIKIIEEVIKNIPRATLNAEPIIYNKEITVEESVKTLEGWHRSPYVELLDYIHIGDKIDKGFIDHFINELPPVTLTGEIAQIAGISSTDVSGHNLYITFATDKPFGDWYFQGECRINERENGNWKLEQYDMTEYEEYVEEMEEENVQ